MQPKMRTDIQAFHFLAPAGSLQRSGETGQTKQTFDGASLDTINMNKTTNRICRDKITTERRYFRIRVKNVSCLEASFIGLPSS
jgi:hypothetical protein